MTWGRTLKKALKCKGLPVNFKEWRAIAEERSESKDEYCIAQKDTQPSQTCSGGFIKTQLYAICCCYFAIGEYNLI